VRALNAWRTQIIRDLGGMQELTAQKLTIVDLAREAKTSPRLDRRVASESTEIG
jgi:hypothetical protein